MKQFTLGLLLAIGLVSGGVWIPAAQASPLDGDEDVLLLQRMSRGVSRIAEHALPAVVFIQVEKTVEQAQRPQQFNDPFDFFGDDLLRRFFGPQMRPQPQQPRRFRQQGAGSGFIVTEDGYILTNSHVVGDADKITVRLHDGREFEATLVGSDKQSEVAIIKIEGQNLPTLALGDSGELTIGQFVIAIGNPFGLNESVTFGTVSALRRSNVGIADYEDFIQTDAAINPGNSGGPLVDATGRVIGINTAIYTRSGGHMGIGFAIPINMARAIKQQLIDTGRVARGYLGVMIQDLTSDLAETFGLEDTRGILVSDIEPESAAAEAGVQQGDVIVKLNGRPVGRTGEFRNTVSSNPPGTELQLTIIRDGEEIEIAVVTGALPGDLAQVPDAVNEIYEQLGMTVSELTPELAERFNYAADSGVIVTEIEPRGLAAQGGIRPGTLVTSVNLQSVASMDAFMKALAASEESGRVVLRIRQGRFHRYVAFRIR